jgi:hypothetical protein
MGCDIHGTIEMKQCNLGGGDGLWYTVAKLDRILSRSYVHFAHLFGVRSYPEKQSIEANGHPDGMTPKGLYSDRGLPHDISETTERLHKDWGADAHSGTWAYQHEIESAVEGTELGTRDGGYQTECWITAVNIGRQLEDMFAKAEHIDGQVRWVVWFDN